MPPRKRSAVDPKPLDSATSMAAAFPIAASDGLSSSDPSSVIGTSAAAPELLVPVSSMTASHPAAASDDATSPACSSALPATGVLAAGERNSSPGRGGSVASASAEAAGKNKQLFLQSAARDRESSPVRGGSVASPPEGSPGKNKQLFLQSVTPQAMTCNLSKLPVGVFLKS